MIDVAERRDRTAEAETGDDRVVALAEREERAEGAAAKQVDLAIARDPVRERAFTAATAGTAERDRPGVGNQDIVEPIAVDVAGDRGDEPRARHCRAGSGIQAAAVEQQRLRLAPDRRLESRIGHVLVVEQGDRRGGPGVARRGGTGPETLA